MRKLQAITVLLAAAMLTLAQDPPKVAPRYGVAPSLEAYPQTSPKAALESAILLIERGKQEYLAAHLIEPSFIDARVAERAVVIEPTIDRELRELRIAQARNPIAIPRAERLPDDVRLFADRVKVEAQARAFQQVAESIGANLAENPDYLKEMKRLLRTGVFVDAGETSSASLPDLKNRSLFFRKVGPRWFIENRTEAEAPAK